MKYFVNSDDHEVTLVPADNVVAVDIPDELIDEAYEAAFDSDDTEDFLAWLREALS